MVMAIDPRDPDQPAPLIERDCDRCGRSLDPALADLGHHLPTERPALCHPDGPR